MTADYGPLGVRMKGRTGRICSSRPRLLRLLMMRPFAMAIASKFVIPS